MEDFILLSSSFMTQIHQSETIHDLEKIKVSLFGKKGQITALMKKLGTLPQDQRQEYGRKINDMKKQLIEELEKKRQEFNEKLLNEKLAKETLDVSLPARQKHQGHLHPIYQTIDQLIAIFGQMGFKVAHGPDVEDDFHNFHALNIPPSHPARQMQDTFYLKNQPHQEQPYLLRTHTSPVQIRTMMNNKPPIRIIAPGRTYRCDYDVTHTPMFHQVEGLWVDKNINMGHLKGCLTRFVEAFFQLDQVPLRFRPSYFPFTEPSAEVDIRCKRENGQLILGQGDDWMEILGCGMVHPHVLEMCGVDPDVYQGFAFGVGIERIAMLKYGISDLRTFFETDVRWLHHYGFDPLSFPNMVRGEMG